VRPWGSVTSRVLSGRSLACQRGVWRMRNRKS
jgi:hypothetical protein